MHLQLLAISEGVLYYVYVSPWCTALYLREINSLWGMRSFSARGVKLVSACERVAVNINILPHKHTK